MRLLGCRQAILLSTALVGFGTIASPTCVFAEPLANAAPGVEGVTLHPVQIAQQTAADEATEKGKGTEEIVVTGTLIRGIAPAGANLIAVDPIQIQATGAVSTNDLLNNIPQMGDFGNVNQQISAVNLQITTIRPNLRSIPGFNQAGGSTTLILMDGHRLVGEGIKTTAPDPNLIPPSLLERVEVLPDGGSATYGADAVGGVINFITKRHFNGEEADARFGFAGAYKTYDVTATVGHDWGRLGAYLSYSYTDHTALFGRDTDYVHKYGANAQLNPDLTCIPGNVIIRSGTSQTVYGLPNLLPNTPNSCDTSGNASLYPEIIRHSGFGGLSYDFNDNVKLDVRGYYSTQLQTNDGGAFTNSGASITPTNPFYRPVPGLPANTAESVAFSYAPVFGNDAAISNTRLSSWGISPAVTWDIGDSGWQIRELTNYGGSLSRSYNPGLNPTAVTAALTSSNPATALNPYDIASTNPAVLNGLKDIGLYGVSRQELIDERVVGDGKLFAVPGGDVHIAVGAEYMYERYRGKQQQNVLIGAEGLIPFQGGSRNSYAGFGEAQIPIVGPSNARPGIQSLNLSASARYDHYSDFGGAFNPKFALTYEPNDWIKIRGNWGTAYNAPSLGDSHAVDNSILIAPAIAFPNPLPGQFTPAQTLWNVVATQGGIPGLKPQTAHTWEIGTDILPPIIDGLKLSTTYYHIDLFHGIGTPPVGNTFTFYSFYQTAYTMNPTQAQVLALAALVPNGLAAVAPLFQPGALPIYAIVDDRRSNFGPTKVAGLDFSANYNHKTSFGSVDGAFNGTYALESKTAPFEGLPFVDNLQINQSRFSFTTNVGANIGDLRAQLSLNHVQGFKVTATAADNNQSHIASNNDYKLFLRYDFSHMDSGSGITNNLTATLTIDNLFDKDPPLYQGVYTSIYNGYGNGSTVGRLVMIGLNKKF